jgi:hypothetical protein
MIIEGFFQEREKDGITEPRINIEIVTNNVSIEVNCLIDTGADNSYFPSNFIEKLNIDTSKLLLKSNISGVGSSNLECYIYTCEVVLRTKYNQKLQISMSIGIFKDKNALDEPIIGRDLLDLFDLIISKRKNEVLLLFDDTSYQLLS